MKYFYIILLQLLIIACNQSKNIAVDNENYSSPISIKGKNLLENFLIDKSANNLDLGTKKINFLYRREVLDLFDTSEYLGDTIVYYEFRNSYFGAPQFDYCLIYKSIDRLTRRYEPHDSLILGKIVSLRETPISKADSCTIKYILGNKIDDLGKSKNNQSLLVILTRKEYTYELKYFKNLIYRFPSPKTTIIIGDLVKEK